MPLVLDVLGCISSKLDTDPVNTSFLLHHEASRMISVHHSIPIAVGELRYGTINKQIMPCRHVPYTTKKNKYKHVVQHSEFSKQKLLFQICLFWFLFSAISSNKNIHENLGCDCHGVHAFLGASTPELLWLLEVSLLGSDHYIPLHHVPGLKLKNMMRPNIYGVIIVIWSLWYIYICFFEKGFY